MSKESKIQTRIIEYARSLGFAAKRNYMGPGAETGWPDVEIFVPYGKVVFIEFKSPGKKPRKIQEYRIEKLRQLGFRVLICDDYDEARDIIDECLHGT